MRAALISIGCGLLLGCAPDVGANTSERCDTDSDCSAGLCYRGFCVEQDAATRVPGSVSLEPTALSGNPDVGSSPPTVAISDAASKTDSTPQTEVDAGAATAATQSVPPSAAAPGQNVPAPSQPTPAATAPGMPSAPLAVDAGGAAAKPTPSPVDAGTPPTPGHCTWAECCAEALAATAAGSEDEKQEKGEKAGGKTTQNKSPGKSCGCGDPALLSTLTCGVLAPLGALL